MQPFDSTSGESSARGNSTASAGRVLFVELDGTLMSTHLTWEIIASAIRRNPLAPLLIPLWRCGGSANLHSQLAKQSRPDTAVLPYRKSVLDFLRQRRSEGWQLVLVSKDQEEIPNEVARSLGIFDDVIVEPAARVSRGNRLRMLEEYSRSKGYEEFSYVGHHEADLPIWSIASEAVLVGPTASLEEQLRRVGRPTVVLREQFQGNRWMALFKAMRPHHWVKNFLIFAPVLFHHSFTDWHLWGLSLIAFVLFCATSSAIYLLNDLLDAESDRRHPVKRKRPFASGKVSLRQGIVTAAALLVGAFAVSIGTLPIQFALVLGLYVLLNVLYSTWLKRKVMIDILVLTSFYSLRIIAGGEATGIFPSEWLLALSMFLFLSLAFLKRHGELMRLRDEGIARTDNRGYRVDDLGLLESMGTVAGYMSVMVLALYINSSQVQGLYSQPRLLWLVCPLLLYWVSRAWIWARRGAIAEDPLVFAIKDRVSWIVLALTALLAFLSI